MGRITKNNKIRFTYINDLRINKIYVFNSVLVITITTAS